MPFAIIFQIVARVFLWNILFSLESFSPALLVQIPANHWGYIAPIGLSLLLLSAFSYLGDNRLIQDMRDLTLYEALAWGIGLAMLLNGADPRNLLIGILGAVALLRYGRILWPYKSNGDNNFSNWPVLGIFGWCSVNKEMKDKGETYVPVSPSDRHRFVLYLVMSISAGVLLPKIGIVLASWIVSLVSFAITPFIAKRTLA